MLSQKLNMYIANNVGFKVNVEIHLVMCHDLNLSVIMIPHIYFAQLISKLLAS